LRGLLSRRRLLCLLPRLLALKHLLLKLEVFVNSHRPGLP